MYSIKNFYPLILLIFVISTVFTACITTNSTYEILAPGSGEVLCFWKVTIEELELKKSLQ